MENFDFVVVFERSSNSLMQVVSVESSDWKAARDLVTSTKQVQDRVKHDKGLKSISFAPAVHGNGVPMFKMSLEELKNQ